MFFKSKKLIGLDIGTSSIKMAELDVSRRGASLKAFAMVPTPSQSVVGGDIIQPQLISEAVAALAAELKSKKTSIATGLWGTSVIVKKISIPKMDEKLVAEQIRWEAEQYIPFDVNEVNLEFEILKASRQSAETMDVLLVAARQENLFKYVEIVEGAGLQCAVIDVGGFALANCFEKNYGPIPGQNVAVMNIGASVTNFVVIENGEVVFCRDIPVGGLTYTGDIQKAMGISFEEAEAMKISLSSGQPTPEEVSAVIQAAHETVSEEINGSIDFFTNTSQGGTISQCYITGGGSRTPGLITHLSNYIKIPCDVFDPFHKIGHSDKALSPSYIAQIRDFAAVAMGLGLRLQGDT